MAALSGAVCLTTGLVAMKFVRWAIITFFVLTAILLFIGKYFPGV